MVFLPEPFAIVHHNAIFHKYFPQKKREKVESVKKLTIRYPCVMRYLTSNQSFARPIGSSRKIRSSISLMVPSS